nr:structural maintenance of chromosomes protein 1 [Tanacetum cinerariifolium]
MKENTSYEIVPQKGEEKEGLRAIISDDLGDEEESSTNTDQPNDLTTKIQVANIALTRIVAGDFLESLGKELGDDQGSLFTISNWFAFQDNIEDNAPNSATLASAMLDEANFNGTSHGGNSSSDNDEVVVGDDEELVMCNGTSTSDLNPFIQQNKETDGDLKMILNAYVKNAATKPEEEKFHKIRLSNAAFQAQKNQGRHVLMLGKKQGTSINLAVKPRTWRRHGLLGEKYDMLRKKLGELENQLHEMKVDKHENDRDAYLSQVVEALRRLFPSVHGRMTELCRPTQKKYNLGVTVAMGRFMDDVVDNE